MPYLRLLLRTLYTYISMSSRVLVSKTVKIMSIQKSIKNTQSKVYIILNIHYAKLHTEVKYEIAINNIQILL